MAEHPDILQELHSRFPAVALTPQATCDQIPTAWVPPDHLHSILRYLQREIAQPYRTLYDLCAIDERARLLRRANDPRQRQEQPASDFTVVYHLLSYARNADIRLKVPLSGEYPTLPSVVDLWPAANWYEREAWDMFGITFAGHPHLRRLLMPPTWTGHPLRKDHPARATDMDPFQLSDDKQEAEQAALQFDPEAWGLERRDAETDFMFLNLGPQHPGTHGPMRFVLQLDGEAIVDVVPDIGFHHRGAEKMGERQSWHTYIPYTDRIDYLGGVMNNLAYLLAVEQLAGIEVPERVKVVRVMMTELFR